MKKKILSFFKSFQFIIRLTYQVDKKLFIFNTALFLLMAILPLGSLWVLKLLLDRIIEIKNIFSSEIYSLVVLFIVIQMLQSFVQQWSAYYLQKQQYLISEYISMRVLKKAAEIEFAYFEDPEFYDSLQLTQQQSSFLPAQIVNILQSVLQQFFVVVAMALFLVTVHWSIPVLLILFSLPLALSKIFFGQKQFMLEKSIIPDKRKAFDLFNYITTHAYAKELRVFNFGEYFTSKYHQLQEQVFKKRIKLQYVYLQKSMLITFFEVLFVTIFYLILLNRTIAGLITIGGLIIYFQAFQRLQSSVKSIFNSGTVLFQHQLFLFEIMKYLNLPARYTLLEKGPANLLFPVNFIDIRNLTFRYPNTDKNVLIDINMHFEPGKLTAIAGENGSGKSTLLKLLCGLYKAENGKIFFGEKDANDLPASFFSQSISVIFQDFGRYYLTVEDNIALGQPHAEPEKLEKAMEEASGKDILSSLRSGLQTTLGRTHELGEELSGGQWQKIAIARALYKEYKILILDEPTSAIDPIAELVFFRNLKENIGDKIVILITHRLHNLKLADNIYIMENGKLSDSGKFEALLDRQGYFSRFYKSQQV